MIKEYKGAGILLFRSIGNGYEVFLGKRKYNPGRGKWSIPGGGKETYDKDYRACAERELWEETGIDLNQIDHMDCEEFRISIPYFHWSTFIVMTKGCFPIPRPREFYELDWIRLEDIKEYPHVEILAMEIKKLKRYIQKHETEVSEFINS